MDKKLDEAMKEAKELKEERTEAMKSLKEACNAVSQLDGQLKSLEEERNTNQKAVEEMQKMWTTLVESNHQIELPSNYLTNLIGQFEGKAKQYSQQIEEMEKMYEASQSSMSQDEEGYEKIFRVIQMLYENMLIVADGVQYVQSLIDTRVKEMTEYLLLNSNLSPTEVNKIFEYKESYSDEMTKKINSLNQSNFEKQATYSMNRLTLDSQPKTGTKRTYESDIPLVGGSQQ